MAHKKLKHYVKSNISRGVPTHDIRKKLLHAGWAEHEVEDALKSFMSRGSKNIVPIIVAVVVLIIAASTIFVFFSYIYPNLGPLTPNGGTANGGSLPGDRPKQCLDFECFEPEFQNCVKESTLTHVINEEMEYFYRIRGTDENGLCIVWSKLIKHPNPDLLEKWFDCSFDTSSPFVEAVNDVSHCRGYVSP